MLIFAFGVCVYSETEYFFHFSPNRAFRGVAGGDTSAFVERREINPMQAR